MSQDTTQQAGELPVEIRQITNDDLKQALAHGMEDFLAKPSHVIFLCAIYPLVGLILSRLSFGYDVLPLLFPLLAGFALVGPVAALGLYELSRRRELGLDISWKHMFDVLKSPSIAAIALLAAILAVIFAAWLITAQFIYHNLFGASQITSLSGFASEVLTTSHGWFLIIAGCGVGFLFAVITLAISVVSFPLLLDKNLNAFTAMQISINAVSANPRAMAVWGMIVAGALVLGTLPFFIGLAIVLPVLGHATWHLYRAVIVK